jgi:uncharacterized membrane protein YphA (DoxX/SURF4 family)
MMISFKPTGKRTVAISTDTTSTGAATPDGPGERIARARPALSPPRRVMRRASAALMSGIYVKAGWDSFRRPAGRAVEKAGAIGLPRAELLVRANGLGMVVAGTALALGIKPRLSALTLAGLMVPTTLAGHRFWEEESQPGRSTQEVQFLKNLGLIGGLLLFASMPRR